MALPDWKKKRDLPVASKILKRCDECICDMNCHTAYLMVLAELA